MSVHSTPTAARSGSVPAPALADADGDTCTIWYIARRLGRRGLGWRKLANYVTLLIDQEGFPRPFPRYNQARRRLLHDVGMDSIWPRSAVDGWLANFLPPDDPGAADAARVMDERASRGLRLVKGLR
jgi:hypothetical protein